MRTHLAAAAAACLFATRARAIEPDCKPPEMPTRQAVTVMEKVGGFAMPLDGSEAKRLLDFINRVGEPSNYQAEAVLISIPPTGGFAEIGFIHGDCVSGNAVRIGLPVAAEAMAAARDPGI